MEGDTEAPKGEVFTTKKDLGRCLGIDSRNLFRLIHENTSLMEKLEGLGYKKRQRLLTGKQTDAICQYYGYPVAEQL